LSILFKRFLLLKGSEQNITLIYMSTKSLYM